MQPIPYFAYIYRVLPPSLLFVLSSTVLSTLFCQPLSNIFGQFVTLFWLLPVQMLGRQALWSFEFSSITKRQTPTTAVLFFGRKQQRAQTDKPVRLGTLFWSRTPQAKHTSRDTLNAFADIPTHSTTNTTHLGVRLGKSLRTRAIGSCLGQNREDELIVEIQPVVRRTWRQETRRRR